MDAAKSWLGQQRASAEDHGPRMPPPLSLPCATFHNPPTCVTESILAKTSSPLHCCVNTEYIFPLLDKPNWVTLFLCSNSCFIWGVTPQPNNAQNTRTSFVSPAAHLTRLLQEMPHSAVKFSAAVYYLVRKCHLRNITSFLPFQLALSPCALGTALWVLPPTANGQHGAGRGSLCQQAAAVPAPI